MNCVKCDKEFNLNIKKPIYFNCCGGNICGMCQITQKNGDNPDPDHVFCIPCHASKKLGGGTSNGRCVKKF